MMSGGNCSLGLASTVSDRTAQLAYDLLVELGRLAAVGLDTEHSASDSSFIMSVIAPPPPVRPPDRDDPEALIEEARRRARRRRFGYAAAVLLALGGVGLFAVFGNGGGGRSHPEVRGHRPRPSATRGQELKQI